MAKRIDTQLLNYFDGFHRNDISTEHMNDFLDEVVGIVHGEIEDNFTAGGRWDGKENEIGFFSGGNQKWESLSEPYRRRLKRSGDNETDRTLYRSGALYRAIDIGHDGDSISVSSNKPYSAIHQFGGTIKHPGGTWYGIDYEEGRTTFIKNEDISKERYLILGQTGPHLIEMPPSPYITLRPETIETIQAVAVDFILLDVLGDK